jgi:bacterioferritin
MDRNQLIDELNGDLANEYSAIIQYLTYAARISGPHRPELSKFFLAEVPEETAHAQFLANKIVALGGDPVTRPMPIPEATGEKEMLERIVEAEQRAVDGYTARARQAEAFGDKGLQVQLEDMVRDETAHLEETQRILRAWHSG